MSVAKNSNRRRLLRETYGNMDLLKPYNFKLIFLVGKSEKAVINEDVRLEYLQYGDMVVVDFEDSLKYSTLKLVLGLDWVSKHCNRSPYFIKLNDDTFVNIFEIATLLDEQTITKNCIMCSVVTEEHIARFENDLKYFNKIGIGTAAVGELSSYARYPKHCAGDMVVFSNDVLPRLLEAINEISHFWQGDVYVTGFVAQSLNIEYVDISKHRAEPELMMAQYKDRTAEISHYFAHVEDPDVFEELWRLLMDRLTWKTQTPLTTV